MIALLSIICLAGMIVNLLAMLFSPAGDDSGIIYSLVAIVFAVLFQIFQGLM